MRERMRPTTIKPSVLVTIVILVVGLILSRILVYRHDRSAADGGAPHADQNAEPDANQHPHADQYPHTDQHSHANQYPHTHTGRNADRRRDGHRRVLGSHGARSRDEHGT